MNTKTISLFLLLSASLISMNSAVVLKKIQADEIFNDLEVFFKF